MLIQGHPKPLQPIIFGSLRCDWGLSLERFRLVRERIRQGWIYFLAHYEGGLMDGEEYLPMGKAYRIVGMPPGAPEERDSRMVAMAMRPMEKWLNLAGHQCESWGGSFEAETGLYRLADGCGWYKILAIQVLSDERSIAHLTSVGIKMQQ